MATRNRLRIDQTDLSRSYSPVSSRSRSSLISHCDRSEQHHAESDSSSGSNKKLKQPIVDFTPGQLIKRRRDLLLRLEDQLERFWSATGLNNLVFDNKDGVCGFVCGTLLYVFDVQDESERTFFVQTVLYEVKEDDPPDFIAQALQKVEDSIAGNGELHVSHRRNGEILMYQDISVNFLPKECYHDFAEILEGFLDITRKSKKAFKPRRRGGAIASIFGGRRKNKNRNKGNKAGHGKPKPK